MKTILTFISIVLASSILTLVLLGVLVTKAISSLPVNPVCIKAKCYCSDFKGSWIAANRYYNADIKKHAYLDENKDGIPCNNLLK